MPKLYQKSGFIKGGDAVGYMKYIAQRPGVEKLSEHGPVQHSKCGESECGALGVGSAQG